MNGFLILHPAAKTNEVYYRHPNELKLSKEIDDARETLSELISFYTSRLLDFRTEDDVWIEINKSSRIGLIRGAHGSMEFVVQEDENKRSLSNMEIHELTKLFKWLPKLKRAVISESIDYLAQVKDAIELFRKDVMDLDGGENTDE